MNKIEALKVMQAEIQTLLSAMETPEFDQNAIQTMEDELCQSIETWQDCFRDEVPAE